MDREILFRGKRIDNGEWVEGIPSYDVIGDLEEMQVYRGFCNCDTYEVSPKTICRYTGLTDKNGRKIFEGDIIRYNKKLFQIVWVPGCSHFAAHPVKDLSWSPGLNTGTVIAAEVVGNIFDNPELLKGGTE